MRGKFILIPLVALVLQSCFVRKGIESNAAKSEFTVENDAIPPDFGKDENTVLIGILRQRKSYDKWVKKAFENYNGEYLLLSEFELSKPEYSDTEKYRYVFDYSDGSLYRNGRYNSGSYKRFFIKDRLEDKMFQSGAEFTFFAKAMEVYVQNLENKRLSK